MHQERLRLATAQEPIAIRTPIPVSVQRPNRMAHTDYSLAAVMCWAVIASNKSAVMSFAWPLCVGSV